MLKIKCDINQQDLKRFDKMAVTFEVFGQLLKLKLIEVVDRVSETQLQVGENSN